MKKQQWGVAGGEKEDREMKTDVWRQRNERTEEKTEEGNRLQRFLTCTRFTHTEREKEHTDIYRHQRRACLLDWISLRKF